MKRWLAKVKRSFTGWSARLGKAARWIAGLSLGTVGVLASIFPSGGEVSGWLSPLLIASLVGFMVAPVVWIAGWVAKVLGRRRDAEVAVVDDALELVYPDGKKQRFSEGEIVSGMVVPLVPIEEDDPAAELWVLLTNGDVLRLEVGTLEAADELLGALALGPGQRRLVFGWRRIFQRVLAAFGGYFGAALPLMWLAMQLQGTRAHTPFAFLWMVLPFFVGGWASRRVRREVVAGTDGVEARIGGKKVSFRFADVDGVEVRAEDVTFSVNGEEVRIPLDMDDRRQARALAHRLERAWEHFQGAVGRGGAERFLRGDLSLDEWKAKLERLLAGASTMREAPLRAADAWKVLEDPDADPEARAGAALALAAAGSDEDQRRVRVAVESTTRPKVRVALDAALEGELEEEQLEAARAEHAAD
ncbi:MAG: hypothetical protein JJ863_08220 [Deltaproteobacteria bacterium]|nr:hypothetical protein [Deltaproteobacteria bacterium]